MVLLAIAMGHCLRGRSGRMQSEGKKEKGLNGVDKNNSIIRRGFTLLAYSTCCTFHLAP
jgi:hypothetical protein